jgi:hypothetical protein
MTRDALTQDDIAKLWNGACSAFYARRFRRRLVTFTFVVIALLIGASSVWIFATLYHFIWILLIVVLAAVVQQFLWGERLPLCPRCGHPTEPNEAACNWCFAPFYATMLPNSTVEQDARKSSARLSP